MTLNLTLPAGHYRQPSNRTLSQTMLFWYLQCFQVTSMLIFTNYGLPSKSFAGDILVIVIMQHASDIVSVNREIDFNFQETEAESYPTMS